jgi:hypothetical protein
VGARGFKPFDFIGGDSDQLAEAEAGKLSVVEHLTNLLGAAAPALG